MTLDSFIEIISRKFDGFTITISQSQRVLTITDFPHPNVILNIKRDNAGVIVLNLIHFKFFNNSLFTKNLKNRLCSTKLATFIATGPQLYIYPKDRENTDVILALIEMLESEFNMAVSSIENVLQSE